MYYVSFIQLESSYMTIYLYSRRQLFCDSVYMLLPYSKCKATLWVIYCFNGRNIHQSCDIKSSQSARLLTYFITGSYMVVHINSFTFQTRHCIIYFKIICCWVNQSNYIKLKCTANIRIHLYFSYAGESHETSTSRYQSAYIFHTSNWYF